SLGCSGALFGLIACLFIDLGLRWRLLNQPFRHFIKLTVFAALGFVLGLLPGVDNFSNIGGFIGGLLIGISMMPATHYTHRYSVILWIMRVIAFILLVVLIVVLMENFYRGNSPNE
ncbi:hypothetical protein DFQ30_001018, partial [Apophysomyces sp. BC1015]